MKYFIVALRIPGKFGVREFVTKSKSFSLAVKKVGEYLPESMQMIQIELKRISEAYFMQMLKSGMREL